jgi:hypothetical protein
MARVLVAEPVRETADLLRLLAVRLGHEVLDGTASDEARADVLVFDPADPEAAACARRLRVSGRPVALVACAARPGDLRDKPVASHAELCQPFTPGQLGQALDAACATAGVGAGAPVRAA